jgi:hypothetical protein
MKIIYYVYNLIIERSLLQTVHPVICEVSILLARGKHLHYHIISLESLGP